MTKFVRITIDVTNAAFEDNGEGQETARILRQLADHLDHICLLSAADYCRLYDTNGNRVGSLRVIEEETHDGDQ